jgi:hypothetical protein
MGYMTYYGEEDAEVVGHWLRKVERVINQMQMLKELRVDCVTQLLVEPSERGDWGRYWDGGTFVKSLKRGTILGSIEGRKNKSFWI